MNNKIVSYFLKDLVISGRIFETAVCYVLSLIVPTDKHTQANAERLTGKDNSLFSNFLASDPAISSLCLNRASKRALKKLSRKRKSIEKGAPWTIAIIIDATLHRRSSRHIENAQRFNHGSGWVTGHQWTNIGFFLSGQFIPLPPIPFYTKKICKEKGWKYLTEHQRVANFLRTLSLPALGLDNVSTDETVVLMDSGYDCKELQNTILGRKWDFIGGLKCTRKISPEPKSWYRVDQYFEDGRRPWKSIRITSSRGKNKQRQYRFKLRVGFLKGVRRQVQLVCSKRSRDKKCKFLTSSNLNVSAKVVILCYRKRWDIEIFHREIKSYLGLEHSRVRKFSSLQNHIQWVYVAYILLKEKFPDSGIKFGQIRLEREMKKRELKKSLQILSRVEGSQELKHQCRSALEKMEQQMVA